MRLSLFIYFLFTGINSFSQEDKFVVPCEAIIIKCTQPTPGNYFINSFKEYNDSIIKKSSYSECSDYDLPDIDFEKYSLLGFVCSVGGCDDPQIKYTVVRNITFEKEEFNIDVSVIGECLRNNLVEVWCIIPKTNYEIKFNVTFLYTK